MFWVLSILVAAIGVAFVLRGTRLIVDPSYRERMHRRVEANDTRLEGWVPRLSRWLWVRQPNYRSMHAANPDGLKGSGWYYVFVGTGMVLAIIVGVVAYAV